MNDALTLPQVLRQGRQYDPEGIEVVMSREACETAADELERLQSPASNLGCTKAHHFRVGECLACERDRLTVERDQLALRIKTLECERDAWRESSNIYKRAADEPPAAPSQGVLDLLCWARRCLAATDYYRDCIAALDKVIAKGVAEPPSVSPVIVDALNKALICMEAHVLPAFLNKDGTVYAMAGSPIHKVREALKLCTAVTKSGSDVK